MYALGTFRCHGLTGEALHEVTRAATMAQVMYASQAWWGYSRAKDQDKLERLVERLIRQGFLSKEDMDISQQANKANQKLFQVIRNNPHLVIYRLLPELNLRKQVTTPEKERIIHQKITSILYFACCTLTLY